MARILIADADEAARRMMAGALARFAHDIHEAASTAEALEALEAASFDLLICEAEFPGEAPFALLEELHARQAGPPRLLISRRTSLDDKITALDLGAVQILPKPIFLREFATRVRSLLKDEPGRLRPRYRGQLKPGLVPDLLDVALKQKRAGVLALSGADALSGEFAFAGGNLCGACFESLRGAAAARLLLLVHEGRFDMRFEEPEAKEVLSLEALLDETERLRAFWHWLAEEEPALLATTPEALVLLAPPGLRSAAERFRRALLNPASLPGPADFDMEETAEPGSRRFVSGRLALAIGAALLGLGLALFFAWPHLHT